MKRQGKSILEGPHLLIPDILGNSRANLGAGEGTLPGIASPQETCLPQYDFKSIFDLNLKLLQGHEQKKVWSRDTQGLRGLTDASVEWLAASKPI